MKKLPDFAIKNFLTKMRSFYIMIISSFRQELGEKKMKVLRQNRYRVKPTHPDYEIFLRHMKESRAIYNFANFLVRQGYFRRSGKKFNAEFLDEFDDEPSLRTEIDAYFEVSGYRQKRGLYKTKDGVLINADLNGALNIMRKAGDLPHEKTSPLAYLTRYTHICPISFDLCA